MHEVSISAFIAFSEFCVISDKKKLNDDSFLKRSIELNTENVNEGINGIYHVENLDILNVNN